MKNITLFLFLLSYQLNAQTYANSVKSGNFNDPTVWDVYGNISYGVNIQNGHIVNIPSGFTFTNAKVNFIGTGKLNFETSTSKWVHAPDGKTTANAAISAVEIKKYYPNSTDGIYYIDLPIVGIQQVYCLMDSKYDGGGWMLAMKAAPGTTFNYDASYWTALNNLHPDDLTRNSGDSKYDVMNYYSAYDLMALWPSLPSITGNTGSTMSGIGMWSWLQNNFNNGTRITLVSKFSGGQSAYILNTSGNLTGFSGFNSTYFSREYAYTFYGINYTGNSSVKVRWGFAFNNETDQGSNDVSGGIGMSARSYSAGDALLWTDGSSVTQGKNINLQVEMYIR
jgi:hypothetical protein